MLFLNEIIEKETKYDAFIKFYGSCSLKYEIYDCILGLYGIRAVYLKLLSHYWMNLYESPEIAFAKYTCISHFAYFLGSFTAFFTSEHIHEKF